ncbi:MAG: hypothetical protein ACOWWO_15360 [Peptococcaceae bacterium]
MDNFLFSLIFGIIMLVSLLLIVLPLVAAGKIEGDYCGGLQINSKDSVFTTINEIEFDYQMGKLAEDDYLYLKDYYKKIAIGFLQKKMNKS